MAAVVRRAAAIGIALVVVLALIGTTYQGVATALERRRYPHPGGMVKAGRHQLHLYCTGDGVPTVVLEAPATAMSAAWGWVQPAIAEETRVCSYDRAGLGWSEWGALDFNPAAVPVQLRTLLGNAREPQPFVLAGQGFGAALARLTAARYASEVAGLVLIDSPGLVAEPAQLTQMARMTTLSPWLARTGVLRVSRSLAGDAPSLPEPAAGALRTFLMRPDHLTRAGRELAKWNETIALAESAPLPPGLMVVPLDISGQARDAMLTNQDDAGEATRAILDVVHKYRQRERSTLSPAP